MSYLQKLLNRSMIPAAGLLLLFSSISQAAPIVLNISSAQSSIVLTGVAFGFNYGEQSPGALTTKWSGTISADLTAGVFTFSNGSAIAAIVNPSGPFTTFPNPIGIEPGNYGSTATGEFPGFGIVTINGVYKDLVLDLTSGTAQNGVALAGANLKFTAGALDYGISNEEGASSVGTSNLVNVMGPNTSVTAATWNGTTLTLPIKFQTTGSNRVENWEGTIVASLPAVAPVLVNARPYHNSFSGVGSKVDTGVSMIKRGAAPQQIQLGNITSSSQGINGVVLDFDNLPALGDISLEYNMSPQFVFADPIASWPVAPAPASTTLQPDAGDAGSDRVLITWADGSVTNRYICIKVIWHGTTILQIYAGHLHGETTGGDGSTFSVAFGADLVPIRAALASNVGASSRVDIDKNSLVQVADIISMRTNTAKQLSQITIPANP